MQKNELVLNKPGVEKTGWIVEFYLLETDFPVPFLMPHADIVYIYDLFDAADYIMGELDAAEATWVSFDLGTESERRKRLESYYYSNGDS